MSEVTALLPWLRLLWPAFLTAAPLLWLLQCQETRQARELARAEVQAQAARQSAAQWQREAEALARRATAQRETVKVTVTRWRDATARLDTAWLRDTVPVPVEVVREVVQAADTAIRACVLAFQTCEQRVAAKDSIIAAKDRLLRALPRPEPRWRSWVRQGVAFGLGYAVGKR